MSAGSFVEEALPILESKLPLAVPRPLDRAYAERVLPLLQERIKTLEELPDIADFFFRNDIVHDPAALVPKKMDRDATISALNAAVTTLGSLGVLGRRVA